MKSIDAKPFFWTALAVTLALTPACGQPSADDGNPDDCVPLAKSDRAIPDNRYANCPIWQCGVNSAEVNELTVGELHMRAGENTGEINQWNAQMISFTAPDGSADYVLSFENGRLSATDGATTLTGEDLVDSRILIRNAEDCTETDLRIHQFGQATSWTDPSFTVDRYIFAYDDGVAPIEVPVCKEALELPDEGAWAVLVSGERYTWDEKTVLATGAQATGWFNIACHGNALYKMKLMGYDPQPTEDNPHVTTPEQRQSAIKMVTGDYCGTGTSYTETGTPLRWVNTEGWSENVENFEVPFDPLNSQLEALWNEDGALCLDNLRRPDVEYADVIEECSNAGKDLGACVDYTGPYEWETSTPPLI